MRYFTSSEVNYYKKIYKEELLDKKVLIKKWRTYELTKPKVK